MSKVLEKRLSYVHDDLIQMSSMIEKQIFNAVDALKNHDTDLALKIIKQDDIIDDMQKNIDEKSIKIIGQNQPLATDLRDIFTVTKIVTDLERMGDHAVDIAKVVLKMEELSYTNKLSDIPKMASMVQNMIKFAIDIYINENIEDAYKICIMDNEVDHLCNYIIEDLIKLINTNKDANQRSQLLFVAKYLERIADHTTNICECVIYLKTGSFVDLND